MKVPQPGDVRLIYGTVLLGVLYSNNSTVRYCTGRLDYDLYDTVVYSTVDY